MNVIHQNNHIQNPVTVLQQNLCHRWSLPGGLIRTYSGCTQPFLQAALQLLHHSRDQHLSGETHGPHTATGLDEHCYFPNSTDTGSLLVILWPALTSWPVPRAAASYPPLGPVWGQDSRAAQFPEAAKLLWAAADRNPELRKPEQRRWERPLV